MIKHSTGLEFFSQEGNGNKNVVYPGRVKKTVPWLVGVWILFLVALLCGKPLTLEKIMAKGSLFIPVAVGYRYFPGNIEISRNSIVITCREKIFQPINDFETPRVNKLIIEKDDFYKIEITENTLFIYPCQDFYFKYRHLICHWDIGILLSYEEKILIFVLDKTYSLTDGDRAIINQINR